MGLIVTGMVLTGAISLWALIKLVRYPGSRTRTLAMEILALIILTAFVFFSSFWWSVGAIAMVSAILPGVLAIWASAVTFNMVLVFRSTSWLKDDTFLAGLIYVPAVILSCATAAAAYVPGVLTPVTKGDLFFVEFGSLGLGFAAVGTIYQTGTLIVLGLVIRSGRSKQRRELIITFFLIALAYINAMVLMYPTPRESSLGTTLFFESIVGVALAYIVMKRSPLIMPSPEKPIMDKPVELLRPGGTYLFFREKARARELFALYMKSGKEGLWITRRPPREARELYGLVKTPFIWLTGAVVEGENCIDPAEFGPLSSAIGSFIEKANDYLILIEGLEYITTKTGFSTVLKFVQYLNDRMMSTGGILMIGLSPSTFASRDLAMLMSEAAGVFEEEEVSGAAQNKGSPSPDAGAA
jgi:hypothetical protein